MNRWIGVDLDGTLAHYDYQNGLDEIGDPVPTMLSRVNMWLKQGVEVRILTARASVPELIPPIREWLVKHGLPQLEITCSKDLGMIELWDDRAIQVEFNTGEVAKTFKQSLNLVSSSAEPVALLHTLDASVDNEGLSYSSLIDSLDNEAAPPAFLETLSNVDNSPLIQFVSK